MITRFFDPVAGVQPVCRQCPPGTAVDNFVTVGLTPMAVASATFGMACRPWFGALPQVLYHLSEATLVGATDTWK